MKTKTRNTIAFYLSIVSTTAFIIFIVMLIIYGKVLGIGLGLGILTAMIIEFQFVLILFIYMKKNNIMKSKPEDNNENQYN